MPNTRLEWAEFLAVAAFLVAVVIGIALTTKRETRRPEPITDADRARTLEIVNRQMQRTNKGA